MNERRPSGETEPTREDVEDEAHRAAQEIVRKYPVTTVLTGNFFAFEAEANEEERAYFEAFARIAIPELILGAVDGKRGKRSMEDKINAIRDKKLQDVYFDNRVYHEVAHSIIALARNKDRANIKSLRPAFQTKTLWFASVLRDEALAAFFGQERIGNYGTHWRERTLYDIEQSETAEEFAARVTARETESKTEESGKRVAGSKKKDPEFWKILEYIYTNFKKDEKCLFTLFKEITAPLMKRYATP